MRCNLPRDQSTQRAHPWDVFICNRLTWISAQSLKGLEHLWTVFRKAMQLEINGPVNSFSTKPGPTSNKVLYLRRRRRIWKWYCRKHLFNGDNWIKSSPCSDLTTPCICSQIDNNSFTQSSLESVLDIIVSKEVVPQRSRKMFGCLKVAYTWTLFMKLFITSAIFLWNNKGRLIANGTRLQTVS